MRTRVGVAVTAIVAAAGLYAFSPRSMPQFEQTRIPVDTMQLNSLARSGAGLVAAGELGQILVSRDDGASWLAAHLPHSRQAPITRTVFAANGTGLALGHEGWILRSSDGGLSWEESAFEKSNGEPLMSAARLPSGEWLAVGAFGRVLHSLDDGRSWQPHVIPGLSDWHLNSINGSADGRQWLITGEAGSVLRSDDGGASWAVVPPFYKGSIYGAVQLASGTWVAYGMRGKVHYSDDGGRSWQASSVQAPISTYAHSLGDDGRLLLLAGQGGILLASHDQGRSFQVIRKEGRASLTGINRLGDGSLLLSSDGGLQRYKPATHSAAATQGRAGVPTPTGAS